jgi:hypothetical protein
MNEVPLQQESKEKGDPQAAQFFVHIIKTGY